MRDHDETQKDSVSQILLDSLLVRRRPAQSRVPPKGGLVGPSRSRSRVFRNRNGSRADPRRKSVSGRRREARETRVYDGAMTEGVWVDESMDWVSAHEELERLAKERAELDGREGLALLRAFRANVHRHLGYASFAQYVEALFGYNFRTTDAKLRTAMALEELPRLRAALCEGSLPWSAVRELVRVATPTT